MKKIPNNYKIVVNNVREFYYRIYKKYILLIKWQNKIAPDKRFKILFCLMQKTTKYKVITTSRAWLNGNWEVWISSKSYLSTSVTFTVNLKANDK